MLPDGERNANFRWFSLDTLVVKRTQINCGTEWCDETSGESCQAEVV